MFTFSSRACPTVMRESRYHRPLAAGHTQHLCGPWTFLPAIRVSAICLVLHLYHCCNPLLQLISHRRLFSRLLLRDCTVCAQPLALALL